jgi:hypothetical protein
MLVEFIYDADCPNVADARRNLRQALAAAGLPQQWHEWDRNKPGSPDYARRFGSPTILVDGRDVVEVAPADDVQDGTSASTAERVEAADRSCRIYTMTLGRQRGVPSVEVILAALTRARGAPPVAAARAYAALPVIGAALLPKLTCPACWPAYAGLLSALGIGFIDYTPYLLPLTAVFLVVTLLTLAHRASARRGYGPLLLGLVSSGVILTGKFAFDSDSATYGGIGLLVAAATWNSWPQHPGTPSACAGCEAAQR